MISQKDKRITQLESSIEIKGHAKKITTAVYMITDLVDAADPLRSKIRGFFTDILSATYGVSDTRDVNITSLIDAAMSCMEVLSHTGKISKMNFKILDLEISRFKKDIQAYGKHTGAVVSYDIASMNEDVQKLFNESPSLPAAQAFDKKELPISSYTQKNISNKNINFSKEQKKDIQKVKVEPIKASKEEEIVYVAKPKIASRADVMAGIFAKNKKTPTPVLKKTLKKPKTNEAKEKRHAGIVTILTHKKDVGINDICSAFEGCSSKTIQRDLGELIDAGLVSKTGSRRWSIYNLV